MKKLTQKEIIIVSIVLIILIGLFLYGLIDGINIYNESLGKTNVEEKSNTTEEITAFTILDEGKIYTNKDNVEVKGKYIVKYGATDKYSITLDGTVTNNSKLDFARLEVKIWFYSFDGEYLEYATAFYNPLKAGETAELIGAGTFISRNKASNNTNFKYKITYPVYIYDTYNQSTN